MNRDSPDDARSGVNVRVFLAFLQGSRDVMAASSGIGQPEGGRGLIRPFSLAFGRTPAVDCL